MQSLKPGHIVNLDALETQAINCPSCGRAVQLHALDMQADCQAVAALDPLTGDVEIMSETWVVSAWTPCCRQVVSVWVLSGVEEGRS